MRAAIALLLLLSLQSSALAAKRVALVIGNSAYEHTPPLENPKNDATDMAAALDKLGFEVIDAFDLSKAAFDQKIRDFGTALQTAQAGVFFYAGHGLQFAGHNYLVPVDAQLVTAAALDFEMVRLDLVLRTMERATQTSVLFLDACRNNPLARNLARALGIRSAAVGRGLAAAEPGVGTLISFSTQPGNVALDGFGRNSPFTGSLVKQISKSHDGLSDILINVRKEVMNKTGRKQIPWENSSLTGHFYFNSQASAERRPATATTPNSEAAEVWDRTKDSTSVPALLLFADRYKGTYYSDLARLRIEQLKSQQNAAAAGRVAPTAPSRPLALPGAAGSPSTPAGRCDEGGPASQKGCLEPKHTFKDCPECPEMVVLPPGEFMMGSENGDANEKPAHQVSISKPFAIGKFEVTFSEWDACVAAAGCTHRANDARWGRGGRPAINVSWNDAREYLAWLSKKSGRTYRLPTEVEWEYAARAGTTTAFSVGASITAEQANFDGSGLRGINRQRTVEVGSLGKPNAFGLHDMHGNVWEWVADCYVESLRYADANGSKQASAPCHKRSIRGGSWKSGPEGIRASSRDGIAPETRINFVGFRVASSPPS